MYKAHEVLVCQTLLLKRMRDLNAEDYGHRSIYKEELDRFLFHMRLCDQLHVLADSIQLWDRDPRPILLRHR